MKKSLNKNKAGKEINPYQPFYYTFFTYLSDAVIYKPDSKRYIGVLPFLASTVSITCRCCPFLTVATGSASQSATFLILSLSSVTISNFFVVVLVSSFLGSAFSPST